MRENGLFLDKFKNITLIFATTSVLAVALVFFYMSYSLKSTIHKNWQENLNMFTRQISSQLVSLLDQAQSGLEYISLLPAIQKPLQPGYLDSNNNKTFEDPVRLEHLKRMYDGGVYSRLMILDAEGNAYPPAVWPPDEELNRRNFSETPFFVKAKETRKYVLSNKFIDCNGVNSVLIIQPIFTSKQAISHYILGVIHLSQLAYVMGRNNIYPFDTSFVTDADGNLVAHPDNSLLQEPGSKNIDYQKMWGAFSKQNGQGLTFASNWLNPYDNQTYLAAAANLPFGWHLVIGKSTALIKQQVRSHSLKYALLLGLSVAFISLLGLLKIRQVLKRLKQADEELIATNQEIQLRVQQRTKELQIANRDLLQEVANRQQAERWLAESEERLQLALEATNEGAWDYYPQSGLTFFSPRWFKLLGYKPGEFQHSINTWFDLIHPDDRQRIENLLERYIDEGNDFVLEYRMKAENGTWRQILDKAKVAGCDADGRAVRLVGTHADITAQRQAEQDLKESKERFSLFMDNLPALVYIKDTDSKLIYANRFMEQFLGTSNWANKLPHQVYPPQLADKVVVGDKEALETGIVQNIEDILEVHGKKRIYQSHKFAIRRQGKPDLLGGISLDITQRKQAEQDRLHLSTAIEQAAEAVIITNADGTITYVNAAFERFTGYTKAEVLGKTPSILKSNVHEQGFYHNLWQTVSTGKTWHGTFINKRKNGDIYNEEATITPIFDRSGNITNYVAVKRDVTEKSKLENQLRQAQKMEAMATLAGGVAHDFNNILTIISGFAELAEHKLQNDLSLANELGEILTASQRAKELVQQILTFSAKTEEVQHPVQVAHIMKEALRLLKASVPSTIEIKAKIVSESLVNADPTKIHQIIMNLATNAYHAMKDRQGTLTLSLTEADRAKLPRAIANQLVPGNYLCMKISDTGHGIPEEILQRIFDPYFTTKSQGEGTGLGLAITHGIVLAYNGAIDVHSTLGKGTTFSIYLPVFKQAAAQNKQNMEELTPVKPARVLLVDDEVAIATLTHKSLEIYGHKVTSTSCSTTALELFYNNPHSFDLVVTDMTMPKMTGAELSSKILSQRPDMPIVLMTGYSEMINAEEALEMGIRKFIEKPVTARTLNRIIGELVD